MNNTKQINANSSASCNKVEQFERVVAGKLLSKIKDIKLEGGYLNLWNEYEDQINKAICPDMCTNDTVPYTDYGELMKSYIKSRLQFMQGIIGEKPNLTTEQFVFILLEMGYTNFCNTQDGKKLVGYINGDFTDVSPVDGSRNSRKFIMNICYSYQSDEVKFTTQFSIFRSVTFSFPNFYSTVSKNIGLKNTSSIDNVEMIEDDTFLNQFFTLNKDLMDHCFNNDVFYDKECAKLHFCSTYKNFLHTCITKIPYSQRLSKKDSDLVKLSSEKHSELFYDQYDKDYGSLGCENDSQSVRTLLEMELPEKFKIKSWFQKPVYDSRAIVEMVDINSQTDREVI